MSGHAAQPETAPAVPEGLVLRVWEAVLGLPASTLEFRIKRLGIDKFRHRR